MDRTASIRIESASEEMGALVLAVVHGLQAVGYEVTEISQEYKGRKKRRGPKVLRYLTVKKED